MKNGSIKCCSFYTHARGGGGGGRGRGLYQPIDLPQVYRVGGLNVRVTLRDAPDMAGICQMGPLVHLDSIARR